MPHQPDPHTSKPPTQRLWCTLVHLMGLWSGWQYTLGTYDTSVVCFNQFEAIGSHTTRIENSKSCHCFSYSVSFSTPESYVGVVPYGGDPSKTPVHRRKSVSPASGYDRVSRQTQTCLSSLPISYISCMPFTSSSVVRQTQDRRIQVG